MHESEPAVGAAARKMREELELIAVEVERVAEYDYAALMNDHHVCLIRANSDPRLCGNELAAFCWWDMKEIIPLYPHVKAILSKLDGVGKLPRC